MDYASEKSSDPPFPPSQYINHWKDTGLKQPRANEKLEKRLVYDGQVKPPSALPLDTGNEENLFERPRKSPYIGAGMNSLLIDNGNQSPSILDPLENSDDLFPFEDENRSFIRSISKCSDMSDDLEIPQSGIEYLDDEMTDTKNTYSYAKFLKLHSCYDMIPSSSKIVVFDTKLKVKKAFFALVHNGIRSAPVWNSDRNKYEGMLTITDFIHILIRYYKSPLERMWELEEHQIQTWRDLRQSSLHSNLLCISPKESLFTAVSTLMSAKIHRLPVIDPVTGNALYILTHKKILKYIYNHIDDLAMPDFLGNTLEQLGIGTYTGIATIHPWTTVIEALNIFAEKKVSALPIVDGDYKCIDIYAKFDVINLAAERTYNNLDVTVQDALLHRSEGFEGVHKCRPHETLFVIIDRIAHAKVHRLVVVDASDRVLGIISLSDILKYLVLKPAGLNLDLPLSPRRSRADF